MEDDKLDLENNGTYENNAKENETKKPLSNMMKFGIPLVIVLALLGAAFANGMFTSNKAANMLALAYAKNMNVKQVDASIDMTMEALSTSEDESVQQVKGIVNHINIEGDIKADLTSVESFSLLESITYNFDDTEIFALNLFMDNNTLAANVPGLLDEYVYANFDDAINLMSERSGLEFKGNISDYYKLFTTEDIDDYTSIMLDYGTFTMKKIEDKISFGEKATITTKGNDAKDYECDQIILSLTGEEYIDLYLELINKAMLDSRIEALIKTKMESAIEISKENGVLELMDISDEELLGYSENFSSKYAESIEKLKTEMESEEFKKDLASSMPSDNTFKFIFFIDEDKNIRSIKEDLVTSTKIPTVDGREEIMTIRINADVVYNSFDNVTIERPNFDNAHDMTVEPEMTAMTLFMQVQGNLGTYLEARPALKTIMENPGAIY